MLDSAGPPLQRKPSHALRIPGRWGVVGLPTFTLSFTLTFERILREDGLCETCLEVGDFSVPERGRAISMNF